VVHTELIHKKTIGDSSISITRSRIDHLQYRIYSGTDNEVSAYFWGKRAEINKWIGKSCIK